MFIGSTIALCLDLLVGWINHHRRAASSGCTWLLIHNDFLCWSDMLHMAIYECTSLLSNYDLDSTLITKNFSKIVVQMAYLPSCLKQWLLALVPYSPNCNTPVKQSYRVHDLQAYTYMFVFHCFP